MKEKTKREPMQTRLAALRKEFQTDQVEIERVEQQRTHVRETMLRISGALQVLEELLVQGQPGGQNGVGPAEMQLAAAQADAANR